MDGINIKGKIERNVRQTIQEFEAREDIVTKFGEPVIAYVDARNTLFDMFFDNQLTEHPKNIYRPGNTLIVYFIPYSRDVIESNIGGETVSDQWRRATIEASWLSMKLNRIIRQTVGIIGRLSSLLNTQLDWNEETYQAEWSHKLAAYAAGMGEMGPMGSFHTADGTLGCVGSVITDGKFEETVKIDDPQQLEDIYQKILTAYCYEGAQNVSCSDEMIKSCPCGAISESGIDRAKCQAFCKTIDEYIPSPDVCGKCFTFK